MFKVNGEDIAIKYGLEVAQENDNRERAYSNHRYIKPFFESTKIRVPEFKIDGTPIPFCAKGGRPNFARFLQIGPFDRQDTYSRGYVFSKRITDDPETKFSSYVWETHNGLTLSRKYTDTTCFVIEMIAAGGGGTGGGAVFAGVGGGAGGYCVITVDTTKLPLRSDGSYAEVEVLIPQSTDLAAGGDGAPNRGTAVKGRDIEVLYRENTTTQSKLIIVHGGNGANGGDPGAGGGVTINEDLLPEAIKVLYSASGLSANDGVGASTITCPENTLTIGFESEGDDYKQVRGGFTGITAGGGASSGAPSQFGDGGIEGKTNNGYDGGDAGLLAYGAGGGGGHGKTFSQSDGGAGGLPAIFLYYNGQIL